MVDPTRQQLLALRSWRSWLLAGVAVVQGAQYAAHPAFPLGQSAYAALNGWGERGWMIFGAILMCVGGWLAIALEEWDWPAHIVAVGLYSVLAWANFEGHVIPAVLMLPLGLHAGEVVLWVADRNRRRRAR